MILVIGAGVAGLTAARAAHAAGAEVTIVTMGTLAVGDTTSTSMAQGGVAAVVAADDRVQDHLTDTLTAGAGLVDTQAASQLVTDGAREVHRLLAEGFRADRDAAGSVALGLEGAHSAARIVHAGGDRTGAELHTHLVAQLPESVHVIERATLGDLIVTDGEVTGATLMHDDGSVETVHAGAVILATGGYAALYERTSNHAAARGSGIMAGAEAGAIVADLEFVQFHPTVLAGTGQLISEAVRGAGAALLDHAGHRFMVDKHPNAELAPRDVVAREMHRELNAQRAGAHEGHGVWLDAIRIETAHGPGSLARMFPGIDAAMRAHGYDWAREVVPVAPAAHYTMGGIASDLDGRSSVPGLFVAGEVASTGVHGANRLASNSLLEGLVFGRRAGAAAARYARPGSAREWRYAGDAMARLTRECTMVAGDSGAAADAAAAELRNAPLPGGPARAGLVSREVSAALSAHLGIERDGAAMAEACNTFAALPGRDATLAGLIALAALSRSESRGAHQRADFPGTDPAQAQRRAFALAAAPAARPTPVPAASHHFVQRNFATC
ncbi:L-aspartate oxidase [Leucobacter exalbidus]|uniref:L-aspartate oxidase n=1 Tax=Leucobacter exalbidus TaxID=662960 RepID=A0A940PUU8_9MICO|nr:FAD-binding protein [Leucobacter exalbidus]MBP1325704.1 L-aspartate oxidase [Leucobacter exalbidus]